MEMASGLEFGNWVSKRTVLLPAIIGFTLAAFALLMPILVLPAAFCLLVAFYFAYARYLFSPNGRDIQNRIYDLLLTQLDWEGNGQALDIGCGNAVLSIRLAQKYPGAKVTGIDYWGTRWGYSKEACERNAVIAGVDGRTAFQKASASNLPFEDGRFDLAISNLTFHEVSDAHDKREVIREGLRVLKEGGKFSFQDLFLNQRIYGDTEDLLDTIRSWGVKKIELIKTKDAPFPGALKLPFMVGTMAIIAGEK